MVASVSPVNAPGAGGCPEGTAKFGFVLVKVSMVDGV
jgi:hypothetical protein